MTIPTNIEDYGLTQEEENKLLNQLRIQPIQLSVRGNSVLSHAIHKDKKLCGYINETALTNFLNTK